MFIRNTISNGSSFGHDTDVKSYKQLIKQSIKQLDMENWEKEAEASVIMGGPEFSYLWRQRLSINIEPVIVLICGY